MLAGIGLAACLAGLVAIWVARPLVLRSSVEILDATDGGLNLVEEKATRADGLATRIRSSVDPVTSKILQLADKADRTPEDQKERKRIEEELTERLRQVEVIAEIAETSVAFLNKTARLTSSLPLPAFRNSIGSRPNEDAQNSLDALGRLATKLKELREKLAKLRDGKQVRQEIVDLLVRVTRDVDENLKLVETNLRRVREKATEGRAAVAELRTTVPVWTNLAAVIGSMTLVWMGLGQFVLLRRAWTWTRRNQPAPVSKP